MANPIELDEFKLWVPPRLIPVISDGIMYAGSRVILFGRYKSLKSMLAMQLCLSLSRGEDWLGFQTTQSKVMYLQLEVPPPQLHNRIMKMTRHLNGTPHENLWLWYESSLKLDTLQGANTLAARLNEFKPDVLVIDPVYKVVTDTNAVTAFIDQIDTLKDKFQLSILLVHHPRKGEKGSEWGNSDDMLGDSKFLNWADTVIRVERLSHTQIEVSFDVARHAENELPRKLYELNPIDLSFSLASGKKI